MSRSLLALVVAAALFVPTAITAPKLKGRPVFYYPTEVGTRRVYSIRGSGGERDYEHVRVLTKAERDGDGVVVTIEQNGRVPDGPTNPFYRLRLSAAGVEEVGRYSQNLSPTTWALRAPFRVGARWENPDTDGVVGETYTIAGVAEEVEVPAGKFKAIRLDRGGVQVWMAPDVGPLKWGEGETPSAVLTTFTRGAGR